jgi:hypothetical protein
MNECKLAQYSIDNVIFNQGYKTNEGPFTCKGKCCTSGAYIDVKEKDKILEYKDQVMELLDETQSKNLDDWFEKETYVDQDFVSGISTGTNVYNDKCNFQNKDKLCVLQVASAKMGKHKWFLKPFYCILFPLVIVDKEFTYDDYQKGEGCCTVDDVFEVPLYQSCKEEIEYLFGPESFEYLNKLYEEKKSKS